MEFGRRATDVSINILFAKFAAGTDSSSASVAAPGVAFHEQVTECCSFGCTQYSEIRSDLGGAHSAVPFSASLLANS